MMGRNIKMAAVAFTAIITLTGCGTKLYDMTDEEQGLIANYSAYVVAKHNIYQQDGMTNATEKRGDMEDVDDTEKGTNSPIIHSRRITRHPVPGNDKSGRISQKELFCHAGKEGVTCRGNRLRRTLKLHMME